MTKLLAKDPCRPATGDILKGWKNTQPPPHAAKFWSKNLQHLWPLCHMDTHILIHTYTAILYLHCRYLSWIIKGLHATHNIYYTMIAVSKALLWSFHVGCSAWAQIFALPPHLDNLYLYYILHIHTSFCSPYRQAGGIFRCHGHIWERCKAGLVRGVKLGQWVWLERRYGLKRVPRATQWVFEGHTAPPHWTNQQFDPAGLFLCSCPLAWQSNQRKQDLQSCAKQGSYKQMRTKGCA